MNNTWSLEDLYKSIARQWRTLVAVVVVVVGIAVAANFVWPERYSATAVMTVEPITVQSLGSRDVNMDTERVVATSTEVLSLAVEKLPDTTVAELRGSIEVFVPRGADVLEFKFTASDPETAADSVNAIATAYGDQRVATAQGLLDEATANLATRISELTTRFNSLGEDDPIRSSLAVQIESLRAQQAELASSAFYSGSLVSPGVAPADSTKPSVLVFIAAGLFLGVFLGVFIALIRARVTESARRWTPVSPSQLVDPPDERPTAIPHKHTNRPQPQDRLPKSQKAAPGAGRPSRGGQRP